MTIGTTTSSEEFERLTDPLRRELLAHCYRMLGSIHDAEDLVQDVYLRAWRSFDTYDAGRASMRTWMYRIATNVCLTALEQRVRRPLPSGLGHPGDDPRGTFRRHPEISWLEPIPDAMFNTASVPDDPATIVTSRASVRLALIAALQHLPAKQRAVLILRDVLAWPALEASEILGTTVAAVHSSLLRARAQLAAVAPSEDAVVEPSERAQRAVLDRYVAAFETSDVAAISRLLRDDVELEMPPVMTWFAGRAAVMDLYRFRVGRPAAWKAVPTGANGQPAAATYLRGSDGVFHAHSVQVLTMAADGIRRIVAFQDRRVFAAFGFPDIR